MHLVWTYISAAATMCHSLGLHRKSSLDNDPADVAELKRQVFWNVYMQERNMSLILGRKSNFRDDDIDQPYFSISEDPRQQPWDQLFNVLIKFGVSQGRTYDELYSHGASRRSVEDRTASVRTLAANILLTTEREIKTVSSTAPFVTSRLTISDPHRRCLASREASGHAERLGRHGLYGTDDHLSGSDESES